MRRRSYRSIKRKSRKKSVRRISKKRSNRKKSRLKKSQKRHIKSDMLYNTLTTYVKNKKYDVNEKYFTIEYPLLRESLISKNLGLLGEIMKKIKIIEGPVSIVGLNPTEKLKKLLPTAPQILLLGDIHIGDKKCKDYANIECSLENDCYTLYKSRQSNSFIKLLDNLAERNRIGLFIEDWDLEQYGWSHSNIYYTDDHKRKDKFNSALIYTMYQIPNCYIQRKEKRVKNCAVKNLEIHLSDPRKVYDDSPKESNKYKADLIMKMFSNGIESEDPLLFMKNTQQRFFPKVDLRTILKNIKTIYTEDLGYDEVFWNSELFDEYSRTKRQIKKLPKEIQNILRNYKIGKFEHLRYGGSKWVNDKYWKKFSNKYIKLLDTLINGDSPDLDLVMMDEDEIRIFEYIHKYFESFSDIVDLYYIARTFRPEYKFDLSVGFFGAAHNLRMTEFLIKEGLYEKIFSYGSLNNYTINEYFHSLEFTNVDEQMNIFKTIPENDKCIPLT
jgi:hypothetical protein